MRWLERNVSEKRVKRKIRAWMILAEDSDLFVMQDCNRFIKFKLLTSIKTSFPLTCFHKLNKDEVYGFWGNITCAAFSL